MDLISKNYTFSQTFTKTYEAQDIYRNTDIPDFKEFKFTDEFRPPKTGEYYLSLKGNVLRAIRDFDYYEPHLILRKREPKVRYVEIERRYKGDWIPAGEWCQLHSDLFYADSGFQISNTATAIIFRREEFYD